MRQYLPKIELMTDNATAERLLEVVRRHIPAEGPARLVTDE